MGSRTSRTGEPVSDQNPVGGELAGAGEHLKVAGVGAPSAAWIDLAAVLSAAAGIDWIGSVGTPGELARLRPAADVAVMELQPADDPGSILRLMPPALPLVLIGEPLEPEAALRALRTGAVALLSANFAPAALIAAIQAVAAGLSVLAPAQLAALTDIDIPAFRPRSPDWVEPLTPREQQILRMLSEGLANKSIAVELRISEHTAKFHVGQILGKLGAESRTEAVTIGIRYGLILV